MYVKKTNEKKPAYDASNTLEDSRLYRKGERSTIQDKKNISSVALLGFEFLPLSSTIR